MARSKSKKTKTQKNPKTKQCKETCLTKSKSFSKKDKAQFMKLCMYSCLQVTLVSKQEFEGIVRLLKTDKQNKLMLDKVLSTLPDNPEIFKTHIRHLVDEMMDHYVPLIYSLR